MNRSVNQHNVVVTIGDETIQKIRGELIPADRKPTKAEVTKFGKAITKAAAVKLKEDGMSAADIAEFLGISERSVLYFTKTA